MVSEGPLKGVGGPLLAHCWPVGGGRVQIADPLPHEHPSRVWENRGIKRHYGEIEQVLGDCLMRLGDEHVTSLAASAIPHHLHLQQVRYKTRTGPGPELVIKCGPGLFIKHGLMDCMYAMLTSLLSLMRF